MRRPLSMLSFSLVLAAAGVIATSCFGDSCACVTVPQTREDRWIGSTPLRDSLELTLVSVVGVIGSIRGTGVVHPQVGPQRSVTLDGASDDGVGSPSQLTIIGWFATPVSWVRATMRRDSLYGIVFLPIGTMPGDTLGLFLRRQQ
jgi:hypothetical protein